MARAGANKDPRLARSTKPSADAKVILVGAYEGQALSNVSLGGDDVETMVAQIASERGTEPLYIVATSYHAIIWQLTGATERVAMFAVTSTQVAAGKGPRVGVTGLPEDRVFVLRQANCVKEFSDAKASEGLRSKGQVLAMVGRAPDDLIGAYALSKVSLPSGIVSPGARYANPLPIASAGSGGVMWKQLLRFQPSGVADIEADKVVSPLPARRYEVLPREAGLAQLLDEGALEGVGTSRVVDLGGMRIIGNDPVGGSGNTGSSYAMPRELRIVRKMRFPAGLHGAHSVRFILGKGVPMPEGDPGHSTIISEATGQQLKGQR